MRKGEAVLTLITALIGLLASFVGGAVVEAETNSVVRIIGYDLNKTYDIIEDNNITYICNKIKVNNMTE